MQVSVLARMRGARRRAVLSAGGLLATVGVLLVVITPGVASANLGQCGYGNSGGNLQTCVSVGSNSWGASVHDVSSGRVVNTCLYINGNNNGCTGYGYLARGASTGISVSSLGGGPPSGTFCAVTWKKQPDGSVVFVDQECVGYYH
jgi:hypothetical protein